MRACDLPKAYMRCSILMAWHVAGYTCPELDVQGQTPRLTQPS